MKIRTGDTVRVISGKDKGKTGKVLRALPYSSQLLVEGMNIQKKSQRPRQAGKKGQIVEKVMPIHVSNVMLLDPKDNKPTRVGFTVLGEKKIRVAKKSGAKLSEK